MDEDASIVEPCLINVNPYKTVRDRYVLNLKTNFCLNAHSGSLSEAASMFKNPGSLAFHSRSLWSRFIAILDFSLMVRLVEW